MTLSERFGYAGLIPFFITAVMVYLGSDSGLDYFQQYSVLILCFMSGASWGVAQMDVQGNLKYLGVPIVVFLLGLVSYFLPSTLSLVLLLSCFVVLLWLDFQAFFKHKLSNSYQRMRLILTIIVACLHGFVLYQTL